MSWAQRRKATYILGILFIFFVIFIIFVFNVTNRAPTCNDGIQNQGETGIDCGGPCTILCRAEYNDPVVIWGPRWAKVQSSGLYNFLTYIQNPNVGAGAFNVPYTFSVYDAQNVLLYQKKDRMYVPPNNNFVFYDDNINLHDKIPFRANFVFTGGGLVWQKMISMESDLTAVSKTLINEDTKPKLNATIRNSSLKSINNIEVVAILYDEDNNAVAFSRTKIDSIAGDSTEDIVFTWPERFTKTIIRIDLISKVLPQ